MITRRTFVVMALAAALGRGPNAASQPTIGAKKIGWLSGVALPPEEEKLITSTLRGLGWVEGRNFVIERRFGGPTPDQLQRFALELVQLNVDVIFARSNSEVAAARASTGSIPIVMLAGVDPVGAGLITSLARPGGNVTGTTYTLKETGAKKLALLKEIAPKISRVAILWGSAAPGSRAYHDEALAAASSIGVQVHSYPVQSVEDVDAAISKIKRNRDDALYLIGTGQFALANRLPTIMRFAAENRLPAIYPASALAEAGGLISYAPAFTNLVHRSLSYVDRILRGAKPAELPVEQPTKFELVINRKAARDLGLQIPQSLLLRADRLIE